MNGRRRLDRKSGSGGRTGTGNRVVNIGNSRCQRDFSKQGNARLAPPPPSFFQRSRPVARIAPLRVVSPRDEDVAITIFSSSRKSKIKGDPRHFRENRKSEDRVLEIRVAYVSGNIGEWLGRWVS